MQPVCDSWASCLLTYCTESNGTNTTIHIHCMKLTTYLNSFDISVEERLQLKQKVVCCCLHQIALGLTQFLLRLTVFHQRAACNPRAALHSYWTAINSVEFRGSYSARSNHMTLVHWPLMGAWAVAFGTARRGLGGATDLPGPSSLYQMWHPTHQRPVYQSPYCCMTVRCSAVLMCPLKG